MIPIPPQPAGLPSGTIGGRRRRAAGAWQWRQVVAAPHRLAFSAGALMMSLALLWWGAALLAAASGRALPWAVSAPTAHALLLGFAVLPCFLAGLVFSQLPRWLGAPASVPARALQLPLVGVLGGWAMALLGFHTSSALAAAGVAVAAGGLALIAGRGMVCLIDSRSADRDHARLVLLGLAVAALAQWAAAVAVALGAETAARAAVQAALWGGFGLVFVTVAHRALPQFTGLQLPSQSAWLSRSLLAALAGVVALQAPFAAAEVLQGGALSGVPAVLRAGMGLGAGLVLCWLALRWGLRQSLRPSAAALDAAGEPVLARRGALRLLALLHLGFAWLAVAFTLDGVSHALMVATDGQLSLGHAPLHAFSMGFLGCTLYALATRMALALSGRALVADRWTWVMAWVLQAGVLLRVLAALFPVAATPLTLLALQFWATVALTWTVRHARWFGRARLDGGAA
jgi:uncharacterized protein involved in response to NO